MNELMHFNKVSEIWTKKTRAFDLPSDIVFDFEKHKRLLNIFQVGDFYCYILNLKTIDIEYISESINTMLGYTPRQWTCQELFNNIHPEDIPMFINTERKIADFFAKLPSEKILKYKARYDIRVRKSCGEYIRILQQVMVFYSNEKTNELKAFGIHTDISHLKETNKSVLSFIGMDGEPSYINVQVENVMKPNNGIFTNREKELLIQICKGLNRSAIGEILNISKHTVDTHRRTILKKSDCNSVAELVAKSIQQGWI